MNKLAEQLIVDIIANEMDLDDQQVWIFDQNRKIPETNDLFIVVGMVDSEVMSNTKEILETEVPQPPDPPLQTIKEVLTVVTRDFIQIDILSRSNEAITRRWELLTALNSIYSVQTQEENDFKIFKVPTMFTNASSAEGGSNLNRFSITISAHVWYRKERVISQGDIYDEFATRVDDANTIAEDEGLIEFTIDENTVIAED